MDAAFLPQGDTSPYAVVPAVRPDLAPAGRPDLEQEKQAAAGAVAAPPQVPAEARGYADEAARLSSGAVDDVNAIAQKGAVDAAQAARAHEIVENGNGNIEEIARELSSQIKVPENTPAPTPRTMEQIRNAVKKANKAHKLGRASDLGRPKTFAQEKAALAQGKKTDAANNCINHLVRLHSHFDSELAYYNEKVMKIDKAYSKISELRGIIRKYESHAAIDFTKPKDGAQAAEFNYVMELAEEAHKYGFRWATDESGQVTYGWKDAQGKDSLDKGLEQAAMAVTTIGKKYPHYLQHIMGMQLLAAQMIATVVQMHHKLLMGFVDRMNR